MSRRPLTRFWPLISALALVTPSPASAAEWFVDLYAGVVSPESGRIRGSDFTTVPTQEIAIDTSYDDSSTIGIRSGLWIREGAGLGFAWDVSRYRAEEDSVDIAVVQLSGLVQYRWHLARPSTRQSGKLQPYVGAGLGVAFADVDVQPPGEDGLHDATFEDSLDLLVGLHWRPSPANGAFFEYRYSHIELEIDPRGFLFNNLIHTIRGDVDTDRFLIGWSHGFGNR